MPQTPRRPTNFAVNKRLRNRTGTKPPTIAEQQRLQKAAEEAKKKPAPTSRTKPSPTAAGNGRSTVAAGRTVLKPPPVVRRPPVTPATRTPTVPSQSPVATPRLPDLRPAADRLPPGGPPSPPPPPGGQGSGPAPVGAPRGAPPPPGTAVRQTKRTPAMEASTKRSRLRRLMEDELEHREGSRLTDAELAEVRAVLEASGGRHDRGDYSPDPEIDRLTTLLESGLDGRARVTAAPVLDESTVGEEYVTAVEKNLFSMQAKNQQRPVDGVAALLADADRLLKQNKPVSADHRLVEAGILVKNKETRDKGDVSQAARDRNVVTAPGFVQGCLDKADIGLFDDSRLALRVLSISNQPSDKPLLVALLNGLFEGDVPAKAATDGEFYMELLTVAARLLVRQESGDPSLNLPADFLTAKLNKLGPQAPRMAARILERRWMAPAADVRSPLFGWMLGKISKEDWDDRSKGYAARAYNALWNAGMYKEICDLVAKGADGMQPYNTMEEKGRLRDGIWSGFVQPLEHLLGNYVKLVHEGGGDDEITRKKVEGAAMILERLATSGNAKTLTTYAEVLASDLVGQFPEAPGTIWGFEDVRLPYVQAARAAVKGDKKVGQRPVRMFDLWKAVNLTLNKDGYTGLLENPGTKIPEYIETGVKRIDEGIAEGSRDFAGVDRDLFVKAFEEQASAFLWFLARQTPSAKFATADLSRRDVGKHMGGLACKAGLWWAEKTGEPVYYVLDGIRMEEATNYKAYKSAQINAIMDSETAKDYLEVITFAELREILKNWDDLKGVIKFVDKGRILAGDELETKVAKWRKDMATSDVTAPVRTLPDKAQYADVIAKLDPDREPGSAGLMALDSRQIQKIVARADMLKMAARAELDLLGDFLAAEEGDPPAKPLYDAGLLPRQLGAQYVAARKTPSGVERQQAVATLREALERICPELRVPLQASVARHFGY